VELTNNGPETVNGGAVFTISSSLFRVLDGTHLKKNHHALDSERRGLINVRNVS
jgi:hypothetical protein